jgi:RND family efflux transporter MFP subunit
MSTKQTLPFFLTVALLGGCHDEPTPQLPPPQVIVATVEQRDVAVVREWIARLDGSINVDIRARVSGYIDRIEFKEGQLVKKGDLLLRIDPRPYEAALAQAKAEVARSIAAQGKTEADERRQTQLLQNKVASQQDYDNAVQANLATKSSVEAARAAQEQARINLDYATITAPIDGIIGRTDFSVGDFVPSGAGGAPVTTISTVDPIKVVFCRERKGIPRARRTNQRSSRNV